MDEESLADGQEVEQAIGGVLHDEDSGEENAPMEGLEGEKSWLHRNQFIEICFAMLVKDSRRKKTIC